MRVIIFFARPQLTKEKAALSCLFFSRPSVFHEKNEMGKTKSSLNWKEEEALSFLATLRNINPSYLLMERRKTLRSFVQSLSKINYAAKRNCASAKPQRGRKKNVDFFTTVDLTTFMWAKSPSRYLALYRKK